MGQIITMIYTCKSMKYNTLIAGGNKFDDETGFRLQSPNSSKRFTY